MTRHVKISVVGFTCALLIVGAYLLNQKMGIAVADTATRNQLRNLSALADDYFAKNGVIRVFVTQLDMTKLYSAGIRGPVDEVRPALIRKGHALEAPRFVGKQTVRFSP